MEIKAISKPQLKPHMVGGQLKVLEVTAEAGALMPLHYCTSDAVVTVQQGTADLDLMDQIVKLTVGSSFLIPAGKEHTLSVKDKFRSTVVMESNAEIRFVDK